MYFNRIPTNFVNIVYTVLLLLLVSLEIEKKGDIIFTVVRNLIHTNENVLSTMRQRAKPINMLYNESF